MRRCQGSLYRQIKSEYQKMVSFRIIAGIMAAAAYELLYTADLLPGILSIQSPVAPVLGFIGWIAPFCVGGYLVIYRSNHPAKQYVEDVEPEPDFSEPQGPEPQSAAEDAAWSAAEDAAWSAAWSAAQTPVSVPVEKPWSTRPEESKQSVVTLRWERTQTLEASVPLSNVRIVTSKDSPVRIGSDEEMVQVTE